MRNFDNLKLHIKELIDTGKITSEKDFENIPINKLWNKYHICAKEYICYSCYSVNGNNCIHNCMDKMFEKEP